MTNMQTIVSAMMGLALLIAFAIIFDNAMEAQALRDCKGAATYCDVV